MNRIRRLRRHLACLPRPAGPLAAIAAVAPARSRWPDPPFPPGWKLPPGWDNYLLPPPGPAKHPPLPLGHVAGPVYKASPRIAAHTAADGGVRVWQIILIAAATVLLAAALAVLIHRQRAARRRGPGHDRGHTGSSRCPPTGAGQGAHPLGTRIPDAHRLTVTPSSPPASAQTVTRAQKRGHDHDR
jgi:hypothetical protein